MKRTVQSIAYNDRIMRLDIAVCKGDSRARLSKQTLAVVANYKLHLIFLFVQKQKTAQNMINTMMTLLSVQSN